MTNTQRGKLSSEEIQRIRSGLEEIGFDSEMPRTTRMFEKIFLVIIAILQFLNLCYSYNNMVLIEDVTKLLRTKIQLQFDSSTEDLILKDLPYYYDDNLYNPYGE
jgi:hypothetical protein